MFNSIRARFLILVFSSFVILTAGLLYLYVAEQRSINKDLHTKAVNAAQYVVSNQKNILISTRAYLESLSYTEELSSPEQQDCSEFLKRQLKFQNQFINIGAPDTNGNLTCNATPLVRKVNVADREYFQKSLNEKSFAIGQFQFDRVATTNSVNFSYPVLDEVGNVTRILVAVVPLDWWSRSLSESNLPKGSLAFVLDKNNKIVANYPESVEKLGFDINEIIPDYTSTPNDAENEFFDEINRISVSRHLYDKESSENVRILVAIPVNDEFKIAKLELLIQLFVGFSIFFTLAIWILHYLETKVLTPIRQLTFASNLLQNGISPKTEIYTQDKNLSALANGFKSMAQARLSAEQEITNKSEELRQVFFALPDLYLKVENDLTLIDYKCADLDAFNGAGNLTIGSDFSATMTLENQKLFRQEVELINKRSAMRSWVYQSENIEKDHYFEVKAVGLSNEDAVILVIQNITSRKEDEKQLRLAASVFENSSEYMLLLSSEGILVNANPAFIKEFSRSDKPLLGKHFLDFNLLSEGDFSLEEVWQKLKKGSTWDGELNFAKHNGESVCLWLALTPIFDDEKKVNEISVIAKDITEFKALNKQTWLQANYDQLTGLANRVNLNKELNKRVSINQDSKGEFYLIFIDLDDFKNVNDVFGHNRGDLLLQEIAVRLKEIIPEQAIAARQGGDEFIILVNQTDGFELYALMEQLILGLHKKVQLGAINAQVSASIGVAKYPEDGDSSEQLLIAADLAMYEAKKLGKNCFYCFTEEIKKEAVANAELIEDLKSAAANNEFELYLQLIEPINGGAMFKAEALLRWNHPVKGQISPVRFIPLAEQTNLISSIGDWVVTETILVLQKISEVFSGDVQISVNLSPNQVKNLAKHSPLNRLCHQRSKLNNSLILEVTETTLMIDTCENYEALTSFRDAGMHVAIDDFGTGYSSLAYLRRYQIDYLKIDREFVKDLPNSNDSAVICQSIISMAHALGIKVIAEGVETEMQKKWLKDAKCDYIQGYLISKPLPVIEVLKQLEKSSECPSL